MIQAGRTDAVSRAVEVPAPTGHAALGPIGRLQSENARQLGDAFADAIVDAIALETLSFGHRIVEADLAKQLKVSRVPIREAIKILSSEGILTLACNRGIRVAHFEGDVND